MSVKAALGMSTQLSAADVIIGEVPLTQLVPIGSKTTDDGGKVVNVTPGITDIILERTIDGASTVVLQIQDPFRDVVRSQMFDDFGLTLTLDGLVFALVQFAKTGDQLQLTFEAAAAYNLRLQSGQLVWSSTTDLDGFVRHLLLATPGTKLVAYPGAANFGTGSGSTASSTETQIMRGTTSTPNEDSWTCINRLANSAGWRVFECEGTIYLGPDTWLLTEFPSAGTLREFTPEVMDIDGTYDIGMPLGQLTVTAMTDTWTAKPGQPITVAGMGKFNGVWLVYSLQRDFFNPQCSITLQIPMTAEQVRLGAPTLQYL